MAKPYRWGDVTPPAVLAIRARRAIRVVQMTDAWVQAVSVLGEPLGFKPAPYPISTAKPVDGLSPSVATSCASR